MRYGFHLIEKANGIKHMDASVDNDPDDYVDEFILLFLHTYFETKRQFVIAFMTLS